MLVSVTEPFDFLLRKKLAVQLQEAAEVMEVSNAKNASLERARHRLQLELGDALSDLGKARSVAVALGQKQQHSDKALAAWKQELEEAQELLQASQKEARALSSEVLTLRQTCEESTEAQETLKRQNQDLQGTFSWAHSQSKTRVWGESGFRAKLSSWVESLGVFMFSYSIKTFKVLILYSRKKILQSLFVLNSF